MSFWIMIVVIFCLLGGSLNNLFLFWKLEKIGFIYLNVMLVKLFKVWIFFKFCKDLIRFFVILDW